jgi:HEAT repeat protein
MLIAGCAAILFACCATLRAQEAASVEELIKTLAHPDPDVRAKAADGLAEAGAGARQAIPLLLVALKDANAKVRRRAAAALGSIRSDAKTVIPALVAALNDMTSSDDPREGSAADSAIIALGDFGPAARDAVPALMDLVRSRKETGTRCLGLASLGRIKSDLRRVVPFLLQVLEDDKEVLLRASAAYALGDIGPDAKVVLPALRKALKCEGVKNLDLEKAISAGVLHSIGKMGADAKPAVPDIVAIFMDEKKSREIRSSAVMAVVAIGPAAKEAVPKLVDCMNDPHSFLDARRALVAIGPDAVRPLIDNLAKTGALGRKGALARMWTICTLGDLGPCAAAAIPDLVLAADDPDGLISSTAKYALRQIER